MVCIPLEKLPANCCSAPRMAWSVTWRWQFKVNAKRAVRSVLIAGDNLQNNDDDDSEDDDDDSMRAADWTTFSERKRQRLVKLL